MTPESLVQFVRTLLNRHDPEGIASDSESDQYDVEVLTIAAFAFTFGSEIENFVGPMAEYINRVWELYFGQQCTLADNLAREIADYVVKIRNKNLSRTAKPQDPSFQKAIEKLNTSKLRFFGL